MVRYTQKPAKSNKNYSRFGIPEIAPRGRKLLVQWEREIHRTWHYPDEFVSVEVTEEEVTGIYPTVAEAMKPEESWDIASFDEAASPESPHRFFVACRIYLDARSRLRQAW